MKQSQNENSTFIRRPSPNFSDDGNSESAMTTLPIGDKKSHQQPNYGLDLGGKGGNAYQMMCQQTEVDVQLTGRNTFAFWMIVIIIFVLTIGNLILTMTIIGVLRLGRGMEHLELVPEADSIKFYGITDLDRVYKKDGMLEGFSDVPVTITGDNGNVKISVVKSDGSVHTKMLMSKNGTSFANTKELELKDPQTGEILFSTHKPHYNIPAGVDNLQAQVISSSRITSPIDVPLSVNNTRGKIVFRGTEGVSVNGKEITFSADQNVYLKSRNGTISINGHGGVYIDVRNIPIVGEHGIKLENKQYKICVCMPQGRLFRIAVAPSSHTVKGICSHFNTLYDPCV